MKTTFCVIALLFTYSTICATPNPGKAIIVLKTPAETTKGYYEYYRLTNKDYNDSLKLDLFSFNSTGLVMTESSLKEKIIGEKVKWVLNLSEPSLVRLPFLRQGVFITSGDSLDIKFENGKIDVTGIGVDAFLLQYYIASHALETKRPTTSVALITSLEQYLGWKKYLDEQLAYGTRLIESYKGKLTADMYAVIKNSTIKYIEYQRAETFIILTGLRAKKDAVGLSVQDLKRIADTSLNKPAALWLRSQSDFPENNDNWYFYQYARIQVLLKHNFDTKPEDFNTGVKRELLYYNEVKKEYKGLLRDRLLLFILVEQIIKEIGYAHPLTKVLLRDYYRESSFPENKAWLKNFEKLASVKYNFKDEDAVISLPFKLKDRNGREYTNNDCKDKIALLYFWKSNCPECNEMDAALKKVQTKFADNTHIMFVNVSTDADKRAWLKQIKNHNPKTVELYTGGQGMHHPIVEDYEIKKYPDLVLLGARGEIADHHLPDPRLDNGQELIELLQKKQAQLNDGPFVIYDKDSVKINYIMGGRVSLERGLKRNLQTVTASTDQYPKRFPIQLKASLKKEPSTFDSPEKQLVLSDIEGNFDAFRKLLQSNGVIDGDYNWTFGKGHLVFVGDMFDRGEQVTECLWLIYMLEEKAKNSGGYVHFILGNHELMNLGNDQRYLRDKYRHDANLLDIPYQDLYNESTELGRWLRTKNIMEKVGDVLYVHGGISRELNHLDLTIEQVNDLIRPHLAERDKYKRNKKAPELMLLFNGVSSPFWYRSYYKGVRATEQQLDSTLQKFSVSHIVTGHTMVADTVSMWYGGKVFNTDTHHAEGKSEALLIEGDTFYRVNDKGERHLLFVEDKKRILINE